MRPRRSECRAVARALCLVRPRAALLHQSGSWRYESRCIALGKTADPQVCGNSEGNMVMKTTLPRVFACAVMFGIFVTASLNPYIKGRYFRVIAKTV